MDTSVRGNKGMNRPKLPRDLETQLLVASRRRCALCFGLHRTDAPTKGQIAHLDRNASNNSMENLVWLCLDHHDTYDSRTSQSKGFTLDEVRTYRDQLYERNQLMLSELDPSHSLPLLSEEAVRAARYLNEHSVNGYKFDPQVRLEVLPELINLPTEDVEIALDELHELGYVEFAGSLTVFPMDRLFWDTDTMFASNDPVNDAYEVAKVVVDHDSDFVDLSVIAEKLGWTPRRVNPAATYLVELGYVNRRPAMGTAPFALKSVIRTARTKRLVRDLSRA